MLEQRFVEQRDGEVARATLKLRVPQAKLGDFLEMPADVSRWEPTPFRQTMDQLVALLTTEFAWALAPRAAIQIRTSGRKYELGDFHREGR